MLRVAVDLTSLLTPHTGVGVFTHEVVTHLAQRDELTLTAFAVTWRGRGRLGDVAPDGVKVVDRPLPARPLRELWKRSDVPRVDRWIGRHDVVWSPNFVVPPTATRALATIHDLTPVRFPALANSATLAYPPLIRRALGRGAWIHTPSEFVRREVIEHFGANPDRVVAVPPGFRSTEPGATGPGRRMVGSDRYILALGTVEPRKDLPSLVRAFDVLADGRPDLRLVIAGADGWGADELTEAVARSRHGDRVLRLGWVEEAERVALLRGATAYAFPSVYEGFGLPPLEAMSAAVPVVATRAGAVPEVCGSGADFVAVGDVDALAAALAHVLDDEQHRRRLVERGRDNLRRYSWQVTTTAFVDLLHRVAGREP